MVLYVFSVIHTVLSLQLRKIELNSSSTALKWTFRLNSIIHSLSIDMKTKLLINHTAFLKTYKTNTDTCKYA